MTDGWFVDYVVSVFVILKNEVKNYWRFIFFSIQWFFRYLHAVSMNVTVTDLLASSCIRYVYNRNGSFGLFMHSVCIWQERIFQSLHAFSMYVTGTDLSVSFFFMHSVCMWPEQIFQFLYALSVYITGTDLSVSLCIQYVYDRNGFFSLFMHSVCIWQEWIFQSLHALSMYVTGSSNGRCGELHCT